jgi:hypothetical protein
MKGFLHVAGPWVSAHQLVRSFPGVSRAEAAEALAQFRREVRGRSTWTVKALRWNHPRAVWTMDCTRAPTPIDGLFPDALLVRDLASGFTLMTLPLLRKDAGAVVDALRGLFAEHGRPLVLKSDGGPEFANDLVDDFLVDERVLHLVSPPYYPEYNGAAEAGVAAVKVRAHYESARNDRPGQWTCDDLEAARCNANVTGRPRGAAGPSPAVLWANATAPTEGERNLLNVSFRAILERELAQWTRPPGHELSRRQRGCIERVAIAKSLIDLEYVTVRRRRISPPFKSLRRRNIPW